MARHGRHGTAGCLRQAKGAPRRMRGLGDRAEMVFRCGTASAGRACCSWSTAPPACRRSRRYLSSRRARLRLQDHGRCAVSDRVIHAGHRLRTRTRSVRMLNSRPRLMRVGLRAECRWKIVIRTESVHPRRVRVSRCPRAAVRIPLRWADEGISPARRGTGCASTPHADRAVANRQVDPRVKRDGDGREHCCQSRRLPQQDRVQRQ